MWDSQLGDDALVSGILRRHHAWERAFRNPTKKHSNEGECARTLCIKLEELGGATCNIRI